jgi:DNA-binding response OmpR family regulator
VKILIIEDDIKLCRLLARGLCQDGHVVDCEHDGRSGLETARAGPYDAIILDVMLPVTSGLSVARELRMARDKTPVLMLTARDTTEDVIAGFNAGADDYLRKPFAFEELGARLRAMTRRSASAPHAILRVDDLTLDLTSKKVERGGHAIELTARELAYLEYFMKNAGRIVTRDMLENALWNREAEVCSNAVEVYVSRLRAKVEVDGMPPLLVTIRGLGYRFGPP